MLTQIKFTIIIQHLIDIKPTEVSYNVDVNMNQKEIKNVKLDRNNDNSVATVSLVKEIVPYTKNALYMLYFSDVFDFTNGDSYQINDRVLGTVFHKITSSGSLEMDIPNKSLRNVKKEGLNVNNYTISFSPPDNTTNFSICLVFYFWNNRSFSLIKKDNNNRSLLNLEYNTNSNKLSLFSFSTKDEQTMSGTLHSKKIVVWLTQSSNNNLIRSNISNYAAQLSISRVVNSYKQKFEFTTQDGVISKLMFSPKFYNTYDKIYHKIMLQEKLDGSYIF